MSGPSNIEERLGSLPRVAPPPDLHARIMRALPERPDAGGLAGWLPRRGPVPFSPWGVPAYAAAAVAVAVLAGVLLSPPWRAGSSGVRVHFELRAPDAQSVELLGSFNAWRPGAIRLEGPDGSGHWTTTLELPAGRHEYIFLVDGRRWVPDPRAEVRKPDGFGHENAVIEI